MKNCHFRLHYLFGIIEKECTWTAGYNIYYSVRKSMKYAIFCMHWASLDLIRVCSQGCRPDVQWDQSLFEFANIVFLKLQPSLLAYCCVDLGLLIVKRVNNFVTFILLRKSSNQFRNYKSWSFTHCFDLLKEFSKVVTK